MYLFQPYREGNQENCEDRDRSLPTVTFAIDTNTTGSQNTAVVENQSEQNIAQCKPGVSMLSKLNFQEKKITFKQVLMEFYMSILNNNI